MKITLIGHSSVLIELAGIKLLTDPWFGVHGNLAYRRTAPASVTRDQIGSVDAVLVSHNHWDHTDRRFLRSQPLSVPIFAPRAAAWETRLHGATHVTGLRWWQSQSLGPLRVTAVPAIHLAIPCGYVIEGEGETIYFAGDTYYGSFMRKIGQLFKLDLALLPVTTFRIPMTMGEKSAVRAVAGLAPRAVIPIHLGIQPRSPLLRTGDTPEGFKHRLASAQPLTQVVILGEGQSWTAQRSAYPTAGQTPTQAQLQIA